MQNFNFKSYMNNLNAIDTGRSNINRILNPSVRYHPAGNNNTGGQFQPYNQELRDGAKKPVQSFIQDRKNDAVSGDMAKTPRAGATAIANSENKSENSMDAEKHETVNEKGLQESGKRKSPQGGSGFSLDLSKESLLNGFILSEILGKPKSLRRGRW